MRLNSINKSQLAFGTNIRIDYDELIKKRHSAFFPNELSPQLDNFENMSKTGIQNGINDELNIVVYRSEKRSPGVTVSRALEPVVAIVNADENIGVPSIDLRDFPKERNIFMEAMTKIHEIMKAIKDDSILETKITDILAEYRNKQAPLPKVAASYKVIPDFKFR
jgi:hypothetical protein